jgi:hypothetical protein
VCVCLYVYIYILISAGIDLLSETRIYRQKTWKR